MCACVCSGQNTLVILVEWCAKRDRSLCVCVCVYIYLTLIDTVINISNGASRVCVCYVMPSPSVLSFYISKSNAIMTITPHNDTDNM